MATTVDSIRSQVDLPLVRRYLREFADLGDYERRLLEMGLREMNRNNARYLPPKSAELLVEEPHA